MKYAILAAGKGSRLNEEGISIPKPLVELEGEPLIDRLIRIFNQNGAEEIVIITNTLQDALTLQHLKNVSQPQSKCPLRLLCKDTPSSMHSFHEMSPYLKGSDFCLTTVDTIFDEAVFRAYISDFENGHNDGLMAVTSFIDDEKPLFVATDSNMQITAFRDEASQDSKYISGGIYALRSKCFATLDRCIFEGQKRMRNFQRALIEDGMQLQAVDFGTIVDIDHADDLKVAEQFIQARKS